MKVHAGDAAYLVRETLASLEARLDPERFVRIHRSTIVNADRIAEFLYITKETQDFIKNVYIPDLLAVASFYKDWGAIGGTSNFLAWGDFPMSEKEPESLFMPRGVIMKRDFAGVKMADPAKVTEHVARAWYEGPVGGG